MDAVFALEGASQGASVLDSLAYIDPLSDADRGAAEALIQEEMQRSKRLGKHANDYIAHLRPASEFLAFKVSAVLRLRLRKSPARGDGMTRHWSKLSAMPGSLNWGCGATCP
jgi:hypothetical protein